MRASVRSVALVVVAHPAPCLFGQGHEGEKIGIQEGLPPPLQVNQVDPFQIRHQALKGGRGKMPGLPMAAVHRVGAIGAGGIAMGRDGYLKPIKFPVE